MVLWLENMGHLKDRLVEIVASQTELIPGDLWVLGNDGQRRS